MVEKVALAAGLITVAIVYYTSKQYFTPSPDVSRDTDTAPDPVPDMHSGRPHSEPVQDPTLPNGTKPGTVQVVTVPKPAQQPKPQLPEKQATSAPLTRADMDRPDQLLFQPEAWTGGTYANGRPRNGGIK